MPKFESNYLDDVRTVGGPSDAEWPLRGELPKWTVVYIAGGRPDSRWFGTAHEFFDSEGEALFRYAQLERSKRAVVCRPYYHAEDAKHVASCHYLERS